MLSVSRLSKRFGRLQALDDLSLHLAQGEIVGFVGANGAGKSTTMRIIMGVLTADSGTLTWKGAPVDAAVRRCIGYMPEERGLYPRMRVTHQLSYLARLHGLGAAQARTAVHHWTDRLGLAERRGEEVQRLSLGNQQRVQLAAALVSDPQLLILDEPFSGLDPVAVTVMSEVLRQRAQEGVPTLFSSHQLDVVERLCDRVVVIRSGRVLAEGTVPQLQVGSGRRWRVVVTPDRPDSEEAQTALDQALAGLPEVCVSAADGAVGTGSADSTAAAATGSPAVPTTQPYTLAEASGRLVITAGGADEQPLLAAAQRIGTVHELGAVRRSLTEVFQDSLTADDGTDDDTDDPVHNRTPRAKEARA
ncbi:ATP-binding cassette domain-containing protein [Actinomyces sp. 2119]|uniref:ABC transporter ATP-binding protein n=1 Tax=Actinomyces sp. 2119 TaxID=2321393 RepID=UPI000E6C31E7|nr:ATP-binding cassette domain-containing protein [Actinomyces sp. 2119]RJF43110.1 ATP-binding cassette domain-containing protein [Actinomyces sp. 2119]